MGWSWWRNESLDLGARLRARRTQLELSREALAASAQLSPGRIGAVERGQVAVSAFELRRLANALNTPTTTFLPDQTPAPSTKLLIVYEALAATDEGADLAEAFARLQTPRLRRHIVQLAEELAAQEGPRT